MSSADPRSLPELISTLVNDLADLVRKEAQLVRAELSEKVAAAARGGIQLAAGGALLLGAYLTILAAIVLALSKVMDPLWATLIVAVATGLAGYLLVTSGIRKMQPSQMKPDRATRQVRKDIRLVKGQAQ